MPNVSAAIFVAKHISRDDIVGRRVLDVGSCDFNGSVAPLIKHWAPCEYLGVDVVAGRGVDLVCSGEHLIKTFGKESFDVVLCVEVVEHAKDWQAVIKNLKGVLRPGGILVVTTRSRGYAIHGFPHDFWRFEKEDFDRIFSDFSIRSIEKDPTEPGVFVCACKPQEFEEKDLSSHALYCVLTNNRKSELPKNISRNWYFQRVRVKQKLRNAAYALILGSGRKISALFGIR